MVLFAPALRMAAIAALASSSQSSVAMPWGSFMRPKITLGWLEKAAASLAQNPGELRARRGPGIGRADDVAVVTRVVVGIEEHHRALRRSVADELGDPAELGRVEILVELVLEAPPQERE